MGNSSDDKSCSYPTCGCAWTQDECPYYARNEAIRSAPSATKPFKYEPRIVPHDETHEREAPPSENKALDIEAIAWAYRKLQTFGVHTGTVDSALMMDRLNLILQEQR